MLKPHSLINIGDISVIHRNKAFLISYDMALHVLYLPCQFDKDRTCRFCTAAVGVWFIHWIRNGLGVRSERFFTLAFITPHFYSLRAYKAWMVLDCRETGNRRIVRENKNNHWPFSPLKLGMPEDVLIPAPVMTTRWWHCLIHPLSRWLFYSITPGPQHLEGQTTRATLPLVLIWGQTWCIVNRHLLKWNKLQVKY